MVEAAATATASNVSPWENNPVKARIRDFLFGMFKEPPPSLGDVVEYESRGLGKWELMVRFKPSPDSNTRLFKIRISEQL
jgi:hypothetical protein